MTRHERERRYAEATARGVVEDYRAALREIERRPQPWERPPTEDERGQVARLIATGEELGAGGTLSNLLRSCSRQAIPDEPAEQAAAVVRLLSAWAGRLGVKDGGKWYAGDRHGAKDPASVADAATWAGLWTEWGNVPPQLTANPMTGEGVEKDGGKNGGKWYAVAGKPGEELGGKSYRNNATVAAWLFALVEFDKMPLEKQAAFWLGVLSEGVLDVLLIVYSAHKSLHGIVRVPATGAGPVGSKANWDAAWGKASPQKDGQGWDVKTWGPLPRLLQSSPNGILHGDHGSGRNGCGLFRLAGHLRTEKVERPTRQALLWLGAMPPAVEDAPEQPPAAPMAETGLARRCAGCPEKVQAVCRHFFAGRWGEKSSGGKGCSYPVDEAAARWYAAGWTPSQGNAEKRPQEREDLAAEIAACLSR